MKYASLVGRLFVGFLIGNTIADLAVAIAAPAWQNHAPQAAMILLLGGLGAFLGFGLWRLRYAPVATDVHGSAKWADARQVRASLGGSSGLIVGRENKRGGQLLRYAGPSHLLTIAPTRSGKGVGSIIPNLLTAERSILCIDPKGENTRVAFAARERLGPVYVFDPFDVSGVPSAAFNPLDRLEAHSLDVAEDGALLADALVYDPPGQVGEAHWNEEAKALIAGLILHAVSDGDQSARNLSRVRELLTLAPDRFHALLGGMQASGAANGLVARAANRHLAKSGREAAGVLSSAQRHTHFLDSPRMSRVLGRSDFHFEDLKDGVVTVFLVLPPDRLNTHSRWLRLMVAQAINALSRSPAGPTAPVLFLLDEFAALGRLEPVERAFGLLAGYGVQLWPILQDMHQLWGTYGERAGTFLSNAGLVQVFNVADIDTASWVSRSVGATTVAYETAGTSTSRAPSQFFSTHTASTTTHLSRRDLLTPDEVMRLDSSLELLLRQGQAPVVAQKVRYFADPEFRGFQGRG